jgi:hypothetical protein
MNCLSGRVDTLAIELLCVDGAYVDETRVTTGKRWRMGGILAGKFARKAGDHLHFVWEIGKSSETPENFG